MGDFNKSSENPFWLEISGFECCSKKEPITAIIGIACYWLCVCASGSLTTDIFNFRILISVSCLHFGQNKGKFSSIVSCLIFSRVLLLQTGHNTHSSRSTEESRQACRKVLELFTEEGYRTCLESLNVADLAAEFEKYRRV